jgi:hypothetical protein
MWLANRWNRPSPMASHHTKHRLGSDGAYTDISESTSIPRVKSVDLAGLFRVRGTMDENALFRHFQAWAQQQYRTP